MRVLVLQEIEANAERIKLSLKDCQSEIVCFSSQPEAMKYLIHTSVDLIISAVHLQSGNVFDFLKWVKADPVNQHAAFIFFCAEPNQVAKYVWPAVQTAAHVLGAERFIAMDAFDETVLREHLLDAADRNKMRKRLREWHD